MLLVAMLLAAMMLSTSSSVVTAAGSPDEAVHDLIRAVAEQRLDDLDAIVCEEQQEPIRTELDVTVSGRISVHIEEGLLLQLAEFILPRLLDAT